MKKIMSTTGTCVMILSFVAVVISCKKSSSHLPDQTNPTDTIPVVTVALGIPPYSGTWKGTINVDDINPNFCYYSGDPITVTQKWVVDPDSSVTIDETNFDYNNSAPWYQTWKGKIYNKDSLSVTLTKNINCFGESKSMTTYLKAQIVKTADNMYSITAKIEYPMCPPDCLFYFNYSVKKPS